jgi:N-acetylmuramoyl-L-alanine amidase
LGGFAVKSARVIWPFAGSIAVLLAASLVTLNAGPAARKSCLAKPRGKFLIVLDVGHTPKEPGATSARGVSEYYFNLELAKRIETELKTAGFTASRVLKIEKPGAAGLRQRPELANKWKADLFLSIHHDSVQPSYLLPWEFENKQLKYSDEFSGYSLFISEKNGSFKESTRFATAIADQMRSSGRAFTTHHALDVPGERRKLIDETRGVYQYDELAVLRMTKMPAVLLEAGVIVNREEEELVSQASYREMVAKAVTAGVETFCNPLRSG